MLAHRFASPARLIALLLLVVGLAALLALARPAGAATPSGKLLWTYTQASKGFNSDAINAAVAGPSGSMYAASVMNDDWGPGESNLGTYRFRTTMGSSGPVVWSRIWDNPAEHLADWPRRMTTDAAGNLIVGGGTYTATQGVDWLIGKRSPTGAVVWTVTYDGPAHGNDYLDGVARDAAGNVYACGMQYVGPGKSDWVVSKFRASDGMLMWTYLYKGSVLPQRDNWAHALAVDSAGYSYITGQSEDAAGLDDIVVMKLTPAGSVMWTDRIDGPAHGTDAGRGIALRGGAVYVSAGAQPVGGGTEVRMIRYDTDGTRRWMRSWHALHDSSTSLTALAVDGAGNTLVCGSTSVDPGKWVAYVVSWTPSGKQRWATTWWDKKVSVKNAKFTSVVADAAGNVWAGGSVDKTNDNSNALLVRLKPTGAVKWVRTLDGDDHGDDWFNVIVLWGTSSLFAGGSVDTTTGDWDALAARYAR